jgi:putative glycosyltransferase
VSPKQPSISIVATTYNSSATLDEFIKRSVAAAEKLTSRYEIILVDDGSTDSTVELLVASLQMDAPIRVIRLSRNFGHHKAMLAGLQCAKGDWVFLVDCDLEEAPELVVDFYEKAQQENADVVYGVQAERSRGGLRNQITGSLFYNLYNLMSDTQIPKNLCVVRIMSRRYLDALNRYGETEMIIGSLWAMAGFKQIPSAVVIKYKGSTSYSWARKMSMACDAVVSTSVKPLRMYFYISLIATTLAFLVCISVVILYLLFNTPVPGFYTLVGSIWLTAGFLSSGLGLIGLYLSIIMKEVKQRPRTVVQESAANEAHLRFLNS